MDVAQLAPIGKSCRDSQLRREQFDEAKLKHGARNGIKWLARRETTWEGHILARDACFGALEVLNF
jgi:hypothetical protein